jgi:hypothetical protein
MTDIGRQQKKQVAAKWKRSASAGGSDGSVAAKRQTGTHMPSYYLGEHQLRHNGEQGRRG